MTTYMQAPAHQDGEVLAALAALAAPAGQTDPYPLYDRLRALGPAVVTPDGKLVITGYRECSALLRDHRRSDPGFDQHCRGASRRGGL